jgi:hypothetical protein
LVEPVHVGESNGVIEEVYSSEAQNAMGNMGTNTSITIERRIPFLRNRNVSLMISD